LQHAGQRADVVQIGRARIVDVGALLRDQQDLPLGFHRAFERAHRLVASHEQRNHHVRIHHDVAQRQDRQRVRDDGRNDEAFGALELGHAGRFPLRIDQ
jgi:hypothetical protein